MRANEVPFLLPDNDPNNEKGMPMFEVGDLVVCVDDGFNAMTRMIGRDYGLRRGTIYTVNGYARNDNEALLLCEIKSPYEDNGFGWRVCRFRPLPSSQIALVNSMLVIEPTKKPVWEKERT